MFLATNEDVVESSNLKFIFKLSCIQHFVHGETAPMNDDTAHFPVLCRLVGSFFIVFVVAFCIMIYVLIAILNDSIDFLGRELTIHNFQSLIAGVLALIGAGWTVRALDRERRDHILRKSTASRSAMPFALSAICDYAEAYIEYAAMLLCGRPISELEEAARSIEASQEAIDLLKNCIEYEDKEWRSVITKLLGELQVAESRLRADKRGELKLRSSLPKVGDDRARDASGLYGRAVQLFPYARWEIKKPIELAPLDTVQLFRVRRELGFKVST